MEKENYSRINNRAEQIAEEVFLLTGKIMPSLESLISWAKDYFGIEIRIDYVRLSDCSGMIYHDPETGGRQIKINSSDPDSRRRFTVCHEIAHLVYGMSEVCGYSTVDVYTAQGKERFCERFAAAYLMPSKLFCYKWQTLGDNELIQIKKARIAKFFGVSVDAVNYRAKELGLIDW